MSDHLPGPLHCDLACLRFQRWARLRHVLFMPHHIPELLGVRPGEKCGVPAYFANINRD